MLHPLSATRNISWAETNTKAKLQKVFSEWRANHKRYDETMQELAPSFDIGTRNKILLLIGPTGVGKSFIAQRMDEILVEQQLALGCDLIGSGYVQLGKPGPEGGGQLITDQLSSALNEPFIKNKIIYPAPRGGAPKKQKTLSSGWDVRLTALTKTLTGRYRGVFLDDAIGLVLSVPSKRGMDGPYAMKYIAENTDNSLLVTGGPEVNYLRLLTGQLANRIEPVWIPPYDIKVEEDVQSFLEGLADLWKKLGPEIVDQSALFIKPDEIDADRGREVMRLSWGTIGIAADRIYDAATHSLAKKKPLDWNTLIERMTDYYLHNDWMMQREHKYFYSTLMHNPTEEYYGYWAMSLRRRREWHEKEIQLSMERAAENHGSMMSPTEAEGRHAASSKSDPKGKGKGKNTSGRKSGATNKAVRVPVA